MWASLKGYKTYVTAGVTVVTAIALYLTGDDTLGQAMQMAITAILAATVRNGISNS